MENTKLEETGVKRTNTEEMKRIVVDITDDSFSLFHTSNLEAIQIYSILTIALEYLETLLSEETTSKYLN